MSDTTLQTPHSLGPEGPAPARDGGATRAQRPLLARYAWWLVALAVLVVAEGILRWANTRPGYDPYGWLDWGYHTWRGTLDLGGAPSWKPFTFVFTVPYSLFGHFALHLWMLTAVAVSLAGSVFAGRIAWRLTAAEGRRHWPAAVAAVFAGGTVMLLADSTLSDPSMQQYFHYVLSAQSDSMLVTFCLAAVDMYLSRRLSWAWWLGVMAGLGRPEVWPFIAAYGVWILWKRPPMRWMVIAGAVITLFFWFGVPTITNHRPNIAGQLALKSPRECNSNKIVCTTNRFLDENYLPIELAALVALVLAALRRDRRVLTLALMVVVWVVVEIAFALHGFPGVPRYLFEASGLTCVLAGIAVGWLLNGIPSLPRVRFGVPAWAGAALVAVLVGVTAPHAVALARREHRDIVHERDRTWRILQLGSYISDLGGTKRIEGCGGALVNVEYVSIMAWYLHVNTGQVAYQPQKVLKRHNPVLYFVTLPNGWLLKPLRPQNAKAAGCASLKSVFVPTAHHPRGTYIRQ